MSTRRLLYLLLGVLCLLRLVLIGLVELTPDEAYYTLWSQYLDFSYYSKGPGIAATIWTGTHLFGVNEFGVRFFSPLLALGTSLLMFALGRRLYGEAVAFWATLMLQVIPIYQAGGLLMTIDPLSMFFWMAALYSCWRALEHSETGQLGWWLGTGALIGAGFLCKWTNALQLVSILLLLALTARHRREFRRKGVWAMLGVFVLFTIPPIVWNELHDRITYHHLFARGGLDKDLDFSPSEFLTFLGAHFGVYSPLIFGAMLVGLWVGFGRARQHFKPRFLLAFAVPIFALYFALAFREAGEANWTAPATLSLGLLTVAIFYEWAAGSHAGRVFSVSALVVGAVMSVFTIDTDLLRDARVPLAYDYDPSARLRGWKSSAEAVEKFRRKFESENGPAFLIGNKYQTSAALAFYLQEPRSMLPGHPSVYIPESQAIENQFSFWPRYDEMEEFTELARHYLASAPAADPLSIELRTSLETVERATAQKRPVEIADSRRHLVQVLQKAMPNVPLDDSFVEEQGASLFAGHTALYITDRAEERPPSTVKDGFERVEFVACLDLTRHGLPLRQIRIFACYNYRGMSL